MKAAKITVWKSLGLGGREERHSDQVTFIEATEWVSRLLGT